MTMRSSVAAILVAATLLMNKPAAAQLNSLESSALLSAVLLETLTVVMAPPTTTFALTGGSATNPAALPLLVTTTWLFGTGRSSLSLYGYFNSASAALVHTLASSDIPAARVGVSVNGGATAAFNQTVPFGAASAGRTLFTQALNIGTLVGTRIDTLELNVDLSGALFEADTYLGTLRVRAQATP